MSQVDYKKIDELLQYILVVASQNDEWIDRQLGMIHLIKYVYLVDLEHAKWKNGETYTGLQWTFHHYGPWSVDLYKRIEPALDAIHATKKTIESIKFESDFHRWLIQDTDLYDDLQDRMGLVVSGPISRYVSQFGSDTSGLLDFVYRTDPMLRAAPEDILDFSFVVIKKEERDPEPVQEVLTVRQLKKQKQSMEDFKKKFQDKLKNRKKKKRVKPRPPKYDGIFFEGIEYLDSLAGKEIEDSSGTLIVSDDMWYSKARYNPDEP